MRTGRVVPGGEGSGVEVEAAAALRWRGGGAPIRARPRGGVKEGASRRPRFGGGVGCGGIEDARRWTIVGGGDGGVEDRGRREGR